MGKKKSAMAGRPWNLLRLALLWARKGGAFKQKLMLDLRLLPRYLIKSLRPAGGSSGAHSYRLRYGERQFSFDDSPAFNFKMHRPASMRNLRFPCITTPAVDFDDDDDLCGRVFYKRDRESCVHDENDGDQDGSNCYDDEVEVEEEEEAGGGVDLKAEEFIAQFYEQMKLQRQVSYLQYNEMLNRGMS